MWPRFGIGTEAGRRDVVRFALAVYRLRKAAGKDPLGSDAQRMIQVSFSEDPHHVSASQLESQCQITNPQAKNIRGKMP
jgi:hypothetical protein